MIKTFRGSLDRHPKRTLKIRKNDTFAPLVACLWCFGAVGGGAVGGGAVVLWDITPK